MLNKKIVIIIILSMVIFFLSTMLAFFLVKQIRNKAAANKANLSLADELKNQPGFSRDSCHEFKDFESQELYEECMNVVINQNAKTEISQCEPLSGDDYFNCLWAVFSAYSEKNDCLGLSGEATRAVCGDIFNFMAAYSSYDRESCKTVKTEKLNQYCLKIVIDKNLDTDGDGLTDLDEINIYKTNYRAPDTDNDGIADGDAVRRGLIKAKN